MQALVWEAPRQLVLRRLPDPSPAEDEVVLCVAFVGICGSELSGYKGENALRVPPLVMGHEFSGEIVAVGALAGRLYPQLKQGQQVTVNPFLACGECETCRRGLNQLCMRRQLIGAHRPGAYADFVAVPARAVTALPETVSLRTGSLTEPTACAVRIGVHAGNVGGESCLVIGAGPIGLLAVQVLLLRGAARVFAADLDPARLAMAAAVGAEPLDPSQVDVVEHVREATAGLGVGISVDAVGTAGPRRQCVAATRPAGTMIMSGLHEEVGLMPAGDLIRRELVVRGSLAYTPVDFACGLALLENKQIQLDPWIVEAPLSEGAAWFERLLEAPGNVSKVLLVPGAE